MCIYECTHISVVHPCRQLFQTSRCLRLLSWEAETFLAVAVVWEGRGQSPETENGRDSPSLVENHLANSTLIQEMKQWTVYWSKYTKVITDIQCIIDYVL